MTVDAEHGSAKLRINLRQLRCYDLPQQFQRFTVGRRRDGNNFWAVVVEAGVLGYLCDAMTRVNAFQPEPPPLAIEAEEAAVSHKGNRSAGTVDVWRACARRA